MNKPCIDIFILSYNSGNLLAECVPSIINEVEKYPGKAALFIVDNASTDGSAESICRGYPNVKLIKMASNGYLFSYNHVIKQSSADYVMVLNSDVKLSEGCLKKLISHFEKDNTLFAVQPVLLNWDGNGINAGQRFCHSGLKNGFFEFGTNINKTTNGYTLSASGAACIYNRNKFLELCGYDILFYPGYYEDSDITWRALGMGWASVFEPAAKGYHINHASWAQVKKSTQMDIMLKTHQLIFMWRHMTGFRFWVRHIMLFIPRLIIWDYKNGNFIWTRATIKAMSKINMIIKRRLESSHKISAAEIINRTENNIVLSNKCM